MTTADKVKRATELVRGGTTVTAACKKAGVSVPTYYTYYKAKKRTATTTTTAVTTLWKRVLTSNLTSDDKIAVLGKI